MHPPADRRCQIYTTALSVDDSLNRCRNQGTHWEKWGGCDCSEPDEEVCEGDFYSWECDGGHDAPEAAAC